MRIWNERRPDVPLVLVAVPAAEGPALLCDRGADAGLVRLPVDRSVLSAIPLYAEQTVVVVPKDHDVAAADEVALAELADEIVLHPLDDTLDWAQPPGKPAISRPATTADAVELVAAGVGLLVVPQSLARLHHRRDLTYRPVTDAPQSQVVLSWREDATTDLVDDFIGVVRGRTVNSTRGRAAQKAQQAQQAQRAQGAQQAEASPRTKKQPAGAKAARQQAKPARQGKSAASPRRGRPRRRS